MKDTLFRDAKWIFCVNINFTLTQKRNYSMNQADKRETFKNQTFIVVWALVVLVLAIYKVDSHFFLLGLEVDLVLKNTTFSCFLIELL